MIKHIFGKLDKDLVSIFNATRTQQFLLTIEGSLINDSMSHSPLIPICKKDHLLAFCGLSSEKIEPNRRVSATPHQLQQVPPRRWKFLILEIKLTSYNYLQRYKLQSTGWVFVSAWASKEIHLSGYCWILISGWHSICLVSGEVSDCGRCLLLLLPRPPIPILCRD